MAVSKMTKHFFTCIAMMTTCFVFGQIPSKYSTSEPTVRGLVFSCKFRYFDSPFNVITVRHLRTNESTTVDDKGYFELHIPQYADSTDLVFQSLRYGSQVIKVALNENALQKIIFCPIHFNIFSLAGISSYAIRPKPNIQWSAATNIIIDYPQWSFYPYGDILGPENVKLLHDTLAVMVPLGFNMYFNRFDFDVNFGFRSLEMENDDTYRQVKRKLYALRFGYQVVQSEILRVIPYVGIRLQHWRLINADKRINTLTEYWEDREIDLRVNQFAGEYGLRAVFAVRNIPGWNFPTLQIGVFGAYLQPLHDTPGFRSKSGRLAANRPLDLNPWLVGFFFGFLVD